MDLEMILKIVFLGLIHWTLVPMAMTNLLAEDRGMARLKVLWMPVIIFVTCFGPLAYLITHELLPQPQAQVDRQDI